MHRGSSGKPLVAVMLLGVIAVGLYLATGMPGMDHGPGNMNGTVEMDGHPMVRLVEPETFAALIDRPEVVLVNVHEPYQGEIEGTDLFVDFRRPDPAALPTDRSTPLAVYCMTGEMSATAVVELKALGFTDISELRGGMREWRASGRPVIDRTQNSNG